MKLRKCMKVALGIPNLNPHKALVPTGREGLIRGTNEIIGRAGLSAQNMPKREESINF